MPSKSLSEWRTVRSRRLDEIENAHKSVGGNLPGRRVATQQINHAYALLLSSQFQGFCRDLHTESVNAIIPAVSVPAFVLVLRNEFLANRKLDRGNPNAGNIGSDFNRLGLDLWQKVYALDAGNRRRRLVLEVLCECRNAIAHEDFDPTRTTGQTKLRLNTVKTWRSALDRLSDSFDRALLAHITAYTGTPPW